MSIRERACMFLPLCKCCGSCASPVSTVVGLGGAHVRFVLGCPVSVWHPCAQWRVEGRARGCGVAVASAIGRTGAGAGPVRVPAFHPPRAQTQRSRYHTPQGACALVH